MPTKFSKTHPRQRLWHRGPSFKTALEAFQIWVIWCHLGLKILPNMVLSTLCGLSLFSPCSFSWDLKRVQCQGLLTGEPPTFWQCGPVRAEKLHWECELHSIHHFFWTAMTQDLPYPTRKSWNEILEHLGKAQSWAADLSRWFLWSYRILINWPCREILKKANRNLQNVKLHQLLNFEMMSTTLNYPSKPNNKGSQISFETWKARKTRPGRPSEGVCCWQNRLPRGRRASQKALLAMPKR